MQSRAEPSSFRSVYAVIIAGAVALTLVGVVSLAGSCLTETPIVFEHPCLATIKAQLLPAEEDFADAFPLAGVADGKQLGRPACPCPILRAGRFARTVRRKKTHEAVNAAFGRQRADGLQYRGLNGRGGRSRSISAS